jgi:hypothetical protein
VRSFRLASARSFRGPWSAIQSGASSVGPSEHVGGKDTAVSIAEDPVRRLNARRSSHIGPFWVRIISFAVSQTVPGKSTWDRTPLGLETAAPCQPRAALAVEGSGKTQVPPASKVPALHREAERDTTGSISRQHLVHTWIGGSVQGKRKRIPRDLQGNPPSSRTAATLAPFRKLGLKVRLTLWF